jgi:toxin ParE1/3/4
MRVRSLRTALANLDAEASYIAEDDPAAARLVVARIMNALSHLQAR